MKNKAVFLDRDGTINLDKHFLSNPEELELLPRAGEAIKMLNQAGFKVIVVSNQSGVGRGYFNEDDVENVNERLIKLLEQEGAGIDKIYYCPHKPDDNCTCRKPKLFLFEKAIEEFCITTFESYAVGDELRDIEPAKALGCKTILIAEKTSELKEKADHVSESLYEAVCWILKNSSELSSNQR